jgi:cell division protease FtsH
MKAHARIVVICVALVSLAVVLWMASGQTRAQTKVTYSEFLQQVRSGQVARATIVAKSGASLATYRLKDGRIERTVLPRDYRDALAAMQEEMVNIEIQDPSSGLKALLTNATPFLLLLGLWIVMLFKQQIGSRPGRLG